MKPLHSLFAATLGTQSHGSRLRQYSMCGLIALAASSVAIAQDNPLAPAPRGDNPLAPRGPNDRAAAAGDALIVPEFIKTGARFIYESGSAIQGDLNKPGSAGVGLSRYDVVAITPTKVYFRVGTYLRAQNGQGYTFGGSSTLVFGAMEAKTGAALWMDTNVLEGFVSNGETQILDSKWPMGGRTYDARSITRVTNANASRLVFDRGTGLLLVQQQATGERRDHRDPFMRAATSSMQFQSYAANDYPWIDAPPPDWANKVRRMMYQGQQTLMGGVGPTVAAPFQSVVEFTQRGEGFAEGSITITFPQQPPSQMPIASGKTLVGGYWFHPDALRKIQPGQIERDEMLKFSVTYEVADTPMGRLGVFKETGDAQTYQLIWAYDLQDGAMVYGSFEQRELGMKRELQLAGRE